jgi:hypothetical protein
LGVAFGEARGIAAVAKTIDEIPRALNIPKVAGSQLSLLLNFGKPCLEIKRIVLAL